MAIERLDETWGPLFGRAEDVAVLDDRLREFPRGLTVLAGRPQQGKSHLLRRFASDRRAEEGFRVGFVQATKSTDDELLRALKDLYTSWLRDASWLGQGASLWKRHKRQLVERLGRAAELLYPLAGKAVGADAPFERMYRALNDASDDLNTGGIALPPLDEERLRTLTRVLREVDGRPLLLIVDALEQSRDCGRTLDLLKRFLDAPAGWPELHLVATVRRPGEVDPEDATFEAARRLCDAYAGVAELVELPAMRLDAPAMLLADLREHAPAAAEIDDRRLLELLAGYPGTLRRWKTARPTDEAGFAREAELAQRHRHPEVERVLTRLRESRRELFDTAVELASLQELTTPGEWAVLAPCFDDATARVADLRHAGLLTGHDPPSFGHTTRYEVTRTTCWGSLRVDAERLAPGLVRRLASAIDSTDAELAPVVVAIAGLDPLLTADADRWRCDAARRLLGMAATRSDAIAAHAAGCDAGESTLAAMGLFNTLNDVKEEGDLPRRDALLEELRALHQARANDPAVAEWLAKGLVNTLNNAQEEGDLPRRDALLEELRAPHQARADDPAVAEPLAKGLFNTLIDTKEKGDLPRRDALLEELRALHQARADDPAVAEWLAAALVNTLVDVKEEGDLPRRDALLEELRRLARSGREEVTPVFEAAFLIGSTLADDATSGQLADHHERLAELLPRLREGTDFAERVKSCVDLIGAVLSDGSPGGAGEDATPTPDDA